jgi:hypothetical protein
MTHLHAVGGGMSAYAAESVDVRSTWRRACDDASGACAQIETKFLSESNQSK